MIEISDKYKDVLLEAIEDQMYKQSLLLEELKGQSMTKRRKQLTTKQSMLEELQHMIHTSSQ